MGNQNQKPKPAPQHNYSETIRREVPVVIRNDLTRGASISQECEKPVTAVNHPVKEMQATQKIPVKRLIRNENKTSNAISENSSINISGLSFESSHVRTQTQSQIRTVLNFSHDAESREKTQREAAIHRQSEEEKIVVNTIDPLYSLLRDIQSLSYSSSKTDETKGQQKEDNIPLPKQQDKIPPATDIKYLDSFNVCQKHITDKYEIEYGSSLLFLKSYGFLKEHCLESLVQTNGDEELSLFLLYISYINDNNSLTASLLKHSNNDLFQFRQTEIRMLKNRYGQSFIEKGNRWSFKMSLKVLVDSQMVNKYSGKHKNEKAFILDFFLPSKYPAVSPLILLKPNKFVNSPTNFVISKILFQKAHKWCGRCPSLYVLNFLENENEMKFFLSNKVGFVYPKVSSQQNKTSLTEEIGNNRSEIVRQDRNIINEYRQRMVLPEYKQMQRIREQLPAFKQRHEILKSIKKNQIIILKGETGCGKSTQVPQFIFDNWIESFNKDEKHVEIICTQPRRLSALGVATRVARERVESIGHTVGYQIRFDHRISENTRLTFCTMGVLLKRIQRESRLDSVTHIIMDEVHERSAEGDLLLLILKKLLPIRRDIRIILMSATVDTVILSDYFGGVPVTEIPGRTFPVEQFFLEDFLEKINYEMKITSDSFTQNVNVFDTDNRECTVPDTDIEDQKLTLKQLRLRYKDYSDKTCQTISTMDVKEIDYELILRAIKWIANGNHSYSRTGTILIFLPGLAEIFKMFDMLCDHMVFGDKRKYLLIPLHSSLPTEEQNLIFSKPKENQSKIILSTNIAETSITIEDCVFVIDTGKMKQKGFDANTDTESLDTIWISRANALQRKGRAGRVRQGLCIHLYTKHRFEYNFIPHPISEIKRIPVDSLILYMKVLIHYDYANIREVFYDFIEPPPEDNMKRASMNLKIHQVIDDNENLTPIGFHLASMPLDVMSGKLLIYGVIFDCLDATLTMAAYMSHKNPFMPPSKKDKREVTEKKKSLSESYSDQITIFCLYRKFTEMYKRDKTEAENFLTENYLNRKVIDEIKQIKYQLLQCLVTMGFVILNGAVNVKNEHDDIYKITGKKYNQNEENKALLNSIMCAAFYPNIVHISGTRGKSRFPGFAVRSCEPLDEARSSFPSTEEPIKIDPKSVNFSITVFPYKHLVFQEKSKRNNNLIFQESTMVSDKALALFANTNFYTGNYSNVSVIKLLSEQLQELINEVCKDPSAGLQNRGKGEKVITALIEFISY